MPKLPDSVKPRTAYKPEDTGTNLATFTKAQKFIELKKLQKATEAQLAVLKEELMPLVNAQPADDKGNKTLIVRHGTNGIELTSQLRVTTKVSGGALDLLKEEKITKPIETIEIVRADVLEIMLQDEELPEDLIKKLFVSTETTALLAKPYKPKSDGSHEV